jgi:DHA3 family macrolide efflux protein-like MFS transporter
MRAFVIAWLGQVVSLLGTSMSTFGLTIWAYERTGAATTLALVAFFYLTPMLAISPIAGALVDRFDRKLMMAVSDLASGSATTAILILYTLGGLQIWHLYIAAAVAGTFQAVQWPAFSAAITTMLPKSQYGRANGLVALAEVGPGVFAPLLAGALLGVIGLGGIMTIDVVTFVAAVTALFFIHIPGPMATAAGAESKGSLWRESAYGFRYILGRRALYGLLLVFLTANFIDGIALTLIAPMVLRRTGSNELIFGTVSSIGAAGGIAGGLAMSAWGGPKRRIHGVLLGWALVGLLGTALMGLGRGLIGWGIASFLSAFFTPIINGCDQAIWQAKVEPDVQGRVFSVRRLVYWSTAPLGTLLAGPLADRIMEPAMQVGKPLAQAFTPLVGSGPGVGMALIFILTGAATAAIGIGGYAFRAVREVETILPDHGQETAEPEGFQLGF